MSRCDVPVEARLSELRHGLLTHPVVIRHVKLLARLRIAAQSSSLRAHCFRAEADAVRSAGDASRLLAVVEHDRVRRLVSGGPPSLEVPQAIEALTRLGLIEVAASPERLRYMAALTQTAQVLDPYFTSDELDNFARIWWSRRRLPDGMRARRDVRGIWALSIPVGGRERYGRVQQRARSVQPATVRLAVEAIAHQLDPDHVMPDGDYLDRSSPRQARKRLRDLL